MPRGSVYHYIASIRNMAKQDYARRYWSYLQSGSSGSEPDRGALSVMGAQAVRIRLHEFHAKWGKNPMSDVWVASAWFSGSDPFFSMAFNPARFTKLQASKKFNRELNRTAVDMWRGGDWGMAKSEFLNDVQWSGIHLMNTGDVVSGSRYEQDEIYDDLAKRGYAYLATN